MCVCTHACTCVTVSLLLLLLGAEGRGARLPEAAVIPPRPVIVRLVTSQHNHLSQEEGMKKTFPLSAGGSDGGGCRNVPVITGKYFTMNHDSN